MMNFNITLIERKQNGKKFYVLQKQYELFTIIKEMKLWLICG